MKFTWCDIYFVQAVSNGHENSKPCRLASCQDTAAAVPPDMYKSARVHSTLLAALIIKAVTSFVHYVALENIH